MFTDLDQHFLFSQIKIDKKQFFFSKLFWKMSKKFTLFFKNDSIFRAYREKKEILVFRPEK